MPRFAVILPAAGKSDRFGDPNYKKQFAPLADRAVWLHAAEKFLGRDDTRQVVLAIAPEDREYFDFKFASNVAILGIQVVDGGPTRAATVQRALEHVQADIDFVCVHDAARPCLAEMWIDRVYAAAEKSGAAILAVPVTATLKRAGPGDTIAETVSRQGLWEAQTPQVARRDWLIEAYAARGSFEPTDEAQLLERAGRKVMLVRGSPLNLKITTRDDLRLAEQVLKVLPRPRRLGPAHPFADDDLWR
jgi:2-C-methyl-D-erythritol 4-phosphate cytidylyltransferase